MTLYPPALLPCRHHTALLLFGFTPAGCVEASVAMRHHPSSGTLHATASDKAVRRPRLGEGCSILLKNDQRTLWLCDHCIYIHTRWVTQRAGCCCCTSGFAAVQAMRALQLREMARSSRASSCRHSCSKRGSGRWERLRAGPQLPGRAAGPILGSWAGRERRRRRAG